MITLNTILLTVAALLPAIVLCGYVFKKDRVEKESVTLLAVLFFLGSLSCFPAAFIEKIVINAIKIPFMLVFPDMNLPDALHQIYRILYYFIGVALVEEGIKYFILEKVTKRNKEFNCLFDGLIYAVFVSLGFAAFENVLYVLDNGWMNAVMRALLSVPGHMFFAVMMGYHYSKAHITDTAAEIENELIRDQIVASDISGFDSKKSKRMAVVAPVLAHGIYNFCCTAGNKAAILVLVAFVVLMYVHCFDRIKKMSQADASNDGYAKALVIKKYPHLKEHINSLGRDEQVAESENLSQ